MSFLFVPVEDNDDGLQCGKYEKYSSPLLFVHKPKDDAHREGKAEDEKACKAEVGHVDLKI